MIAWGEVAWVKYWSLEGEVVAAGCDGELAKAVKAGVGWEIG